MTKRATRILSSAILIFALLFLCLTGGGAYYLTCYALQPTDNGLHHTEADVQASWAKLLAKYPHVRPWADSLQHNRALRDTFITATDGTRLHAYYAHAQHPTDRTAILVHGYTGNAISMMMLGYLYHHDLGYNILVPDLRYAGWSGGEHIQMGWLDRLDVLRWMDVANTLYGGHTRMLVHGISMGAATTMMVAGEAQAPYVRCFVEDCGYTSVRDQFTEELAKQFHLPPFPLLDAAQYVCRLRFGWDFDEASSLQAVARCRLPMLFIHGDADDYVPTRMVYELYEAKPEPKSLWVVPGAGHDRSYYEQREEYTRRIRTFSDTYIPPSPTVDDEQP